MIKISQVKVPVRHDTAMILSAAAKKIRVPADQLSDLKIIRQSLDARTGARAGHQGQVCYQYTVAVSAKNEKQILKHHLKDVSEYKPCIYQFPYKMPCAVPDALRPVVIGTGPAGLFCGLMLARAGLRPLLLERGACVRDRVRIVQDFWESGKLDPDCNVQFGEGGAGTFSDGKLNTLVKDPTGKHQFVLDCFAAAGAPEEIRYVSKPHIGTDKLVEIVENIRNEIIDLGGEVRFNSCVTDIQTEDGRLTGLIINQNERLDAGFVVMAVGHSARDTYKMLYEHQLEITQKAFAIGVRIEHPQDMIDQVQYGEAKTLLPASDYKLSCKTSNGRNVYTFCMCPGGYVVNASSEEGRIVVNGMSLRDRAGRNANSAVIVNVTPEDFVSAHPLAGVEFQRKWEALAFQEGQGQVPVQLFEDFKAGRRSTCFGGVLPVHKGGTAFSDLNRCLPDYVCESLKEGIDNFGKKIAGFDRGDALLSGVETRSSSPIRMERDDTLTSSIKGLYPCGEGAGYAGGITSAAMDGIRVAEAVAAAVLHKLTKMS